MRPHPTLTVISLGGGVQSSVMALMANEGAFDRLPDCSIFADTRWEPPSIYEHLTWLKDRLSFPLYVVDNGRSLREDVKALTNHSGSRNYVDIPVYLKGRGGEGDGLGRRQCTDNYKIRPIRRRIRELLGLRPRQRVPAGTTVELWLGISTDEAIRMKDSRDRWMTNRYPLIEAGMSRSDCLNWWMKRYDRPWNARPASPAPSSPASVGWRPSAGGRSCSPRRWRSTPGCATDWPLPKSLICTPRGGPWPRRSPSMRWAWETTGRETGSETSARDIVGCDTAVKTNDRGLGSPQPHGLSPASSASSVDSRRRSWYVPFTTPIASPVGSRPPSEAVSVFVWE